MSKRSWAPVCLALGLAGAAPAAGQRIPIRKEIPPQSITAPFRLCAGGDVTLGSNLDPAWARTAADSLWKQFGLRADPESLTVALKPFVADADVVLMNVEGAIGIGRAPRKCGPKSTNCFAFRSPPSAAQAFRGLAGDSNVAVVGNVANNHARDAGDAGRDTTVAYLSAAGVHVTGYDTIATPVPLPNGDTIAVLGFYTDTSTPDARDLRAVRRHVARAAERYEVVIVTMHLGAEGTGAQRTRNVNERFLNIDRGNPVGFATAAFEGGATLVVGHGPHVLRAAEWRGGRLALYSLGNLLTYGPFRLREPSNRGVIACATIDSARRVSEAELRPTMQLWPGVLVPDTTKRAWRLIDSLSALDFPRSGVTVDSSGVLGRRVPRRE
jgi:poly-gamma-glutamate capsule biosynthesis protein CapA/YwtB (metallophosphatase superfamily)